MSFDPNTPAEATPSATPAAPAAPSAPQAATPPVTPTPATPATPSEDRSNWVPPYRLRETTQKYEQALQAERAQWQAQLEQERRKIQALTGVVPPENPQFDEVKKQFGQVFPGLNEMETLAPQIKEFLAQREEIEQLRQHVWGVYNRNAMDRLYKNAETTYGQPLSEDARRTLGSSFVGYLQSNPEAYERYQSDPSIVDEFWQSFEARFVSPVRRNATVDTLNRIPGSLPQDTPSGAVSMSGGPQKPASTDERLAMALAAYKAKGGNIGEY